MCTILSTFPLSLSFAKITFLPDVWLAAVSDAFRIGKIILTIMHIVYEHCCPKLLIIESSGNLLKIIQLSCFIALGFRRPPGALAYHFPVDQSQGQKPLHYRQTGGGPTPTKSEELFRLDRIYLKVSLMPYFG